MSIIERVGRTDSVAAQDALAQASCECAASVQAPLAWYASGASMTDITFGTAGASQPPSRGLCTAVGHVVLLTQRCMTAHGGRERHEGFVTLRSSVRGTSFGTVGSWMLVSDTEPAVNQACLWLPRPNSPPRCCVS